MMEIPPSYEEFSETLEMEAPPKEWSQPLKALWHDAKGDWQSAHDVVEHITTDLASWIHAYLHRKEGDSWNAGYWYRRAGRPVSHKTLVDEHREITEFVLGRDLTA